MYDYWLQIVGSVLRPSRPQLERCSREAAAHRHLRRRAEEARARAISQCERQIESARADVFAANDGVVPSRMTHLEHEWRRLRRTDPDAGLMDLWARLAPASWIDRKRWQDSEPVARLDALIALASDPLGVEAAERAIEAFRSACAPWSAFGGRVWWHISTGDADPTSELLRGPLRAAREALSARHLENAASKRASELERVVYEAATSRLPDRPLLARSLAHAAFVDRMWRAASLRAQANPVSALCDLWGAGYVLSRVDAAGATVEIPTL